VPRIVISESHEEDDKPPLWAQLMAVFVAAALFLGTAKGCISPAPIPTRSP
jgi:hypothetical protein